MGSENERTDPDHLLQSLRQEELRRSSAQLRIFLGMSAGVGKTFSMLKAAHQKKAEGIDVVIGIVETHGRSETAKLLSGLELLPRRTVDYRGTRIEEMDLDAILARKPKLVVVDELAHSNAPGSRHGKRYQDVLELLDAGIDVYTALNVQHLESRKDRVEAITGISIRETVPDSILERASLVELVDIAPSELLKRLREGKVYLGDKATQAEEGFFKEAKLTALREIALRLTAERVDQDLQRITATKTDGPWPTNERILVAVSHSPYSERLIRAARRLAYNLESPWIAVHVDTGIRLNDRDQAQLVKNLNLARELNAEVLTTVDTDLPQALRRLCRQKNVTQVIVGRPARSRFRELLEGGSLLRRLVSDSREVDIHVIRQDEKNEFNPSLIEELSFYRTRTGFPKYWNTLWFVILMTMFCAALEPLIGYRAVGFIFLLGVMIVGMFGSLGAVLTAATLSVLAWNIGFIPPRFTFQINEPEDFILCLSYFVVALITGFLAHRIRFHERLMREREERTDLLFEVLQEISSATQVMDFLPPVLDKVGHVFQAECGVVLSSESGGLDFASRSSKTLNENERAVAQWSFDNQKAAGWSTDTLGQVGILCLPMNGSSEKAGVFLFKPRRKIRKLGPDQESLLDSIVAQLGLGLERGLLNQRLREAQRLKDSEALHQTLLNSISHEMRTPLTAILGSAAALESRAILDPQLREMVEGLNEAGERLNRVIENLLDMSRLNSGVLALNMEWQDLSDVLGVVLKKMGKSLRGFKVDVQMDPDIGLIRADFRLFEHAISNLILNATQYSPSGSKILIRAFLESERVVLVVEDNGPGVPEASRSQIFEKFYRVPGSRPGGTGLGLSIVKGIVELHQGEIRYESVEPQGSRFVIQLPHLHQPMMPKET